ncbi:hypothetical protein NCCP691_03120 [Noviherbaspirillum aridicola]|uniref:Ligand-binding protein with streptavidin-like fold n=2 Tax=Noviherbaspirillum aridicola TaxID=2849687 RepID=A0ABQ4PZI0_9BURK|nr:hypothetical protein NCCP691_03120 [Noviherbaspirillum aridicola]
MNLRNMHRFVSIGCRRDASAARARRLPQTSRALIALLAAASLTAGGETEALSSKQKGAVMQAHPYVGMWVTKDGYIRHELLPNGRYDEARGDRKSAYQGRYEITGDHIEYWDDTGFTADGDFRDDVLYHAGMVLYRERDGKRK